MACVFVQIRCKPGTTYSVADEIMKREIHSELHSISGEFDLLLKLYIADDMDIGLFINNQVANIPDIERTLTTLTFKAF
ncbi:MAG: Lrp/AsnC ligand binding domain-containing protein [Pseudomonadota bacterium]